MYDKYTDISIYLSYKENNEEKSNNIFKYAIDMCYKLFSKYRGKLKVNRIKIWQHIKKRRREKARIKVRKRQIKWRSSKSYKILDRKEEGLEKLRKDSEVRWYRNEYKKILKEYEGYYEGLEKTKEEKEHKIQEINQILDIMEQF